MIGTSGLKDVDSGRRSEMETIAEPFRKRIKIFATFLQPKFSLLYMRRESEEFVCTCRQI
jgi:hypothetical protein